MAINSHTAYSTRHSATLPATCNVGEIFIDDTAGGAGLYVCLSLNAWTGPFTAPAGSLVILAGKTFTVNNTLTLAGTDGTTMTFPATSASLARIDAAQTFTFADSTNMIFQGGGAGSKLKLNINNGAPFQFSSLLLTGAADSLIGWTATNNNADLAQDTILRRGGAAATICQGAAAANPPVAQISMVQNASGTDIAGATYNNIASIQTGNAVPGRYSIQGGALASASGSSAATTLDRLVVGATKVLTNNSAITIVNATLASNTVCAGQITYAVEVFNGTDLQVEEGILTFHATNKAGAFANNTVVKAVNQQAATSGTLTVTGALTAANPAVLSVNANSSLTPSTGYPRITYTLKNLTQQVMAVA